jgi:hypothetical protein
VHHPSGEPAGVAPNQIPLAAEGNKDANGVPSKFLFDARSVQFGPIPVFAEGASIGSPLPGFGC